MTKPSVQKPAAIVYNGIHVLEEHIKVIQEGNKYFNGQ